MNDHPEYDLKLADPEPSKVSSPEKALEEKENMQPLKDSNVPTKKKTVGAKTGKPKKVAKRWLIPSLVPKRPKWRKRNSHPRFLPRVVRHDPAT